MAKRFFKATSGLFTVFRASDSKVYQSASFASNIRGPHGISFSTKPAGGDRKPVAEITKTEYEALMGIKAAREEARAKVRAAAFLERHGHEGGSYVSSGPQESWAHNADAMAAIARAGRL